MSPSTPVAARGGRGRAGFSLVEVLVALAVSALCLLMVAGLISRLVTSRQMLRDHTAILDQGEAVFRLIRGLVQSVPMERTDAQQANLIGETQAFEVLSRGPLVLDLGPETRFKMRFVRAAGAPENPVPGRLAMTWTRWADHTTFDETIATGIASFRLEYRARGAATPWASQWSGPVADLALIRVTLTFVDAQGPLAALIAVKSKLPQACVIDPLITGCPPW